MNPNIRPSTKGWEVNLNGAWVSGIAEEETCKAICDEIVRLTEHYSERLFDKNVEITKLSAELARKL